MSEFTFTVSDVNERVFVERALVLYREMRTVCREAPDGEVLARAEIVAQDSGRELIRQGFESVLGEQAAAVEKKGRPPVAARSAAAFGDIADGVVGGA